MGIPYSDIELLKGQVNNLTKRIEQLEHKQSKDTCKHETVIGVCHTWKCEKCGKLFEEILKKEEDNDHLTSNPNYDI